jgi:hypothetical protein
VTDTLLDLLERVDGPDSFLEFARELIADREWAVAAEARTPSSPYGPDAGGWENPTIEGFLEAAVAWATDSRFGESHGLADANPWRLFAQFLAAGKVYE